MSAKTVAAALSDVKQERLSENSDDGSIFGVSNDEDSEIENVEGEDDIVEDDDEFDSEAEPASKQPRLNESAETQSSRSRRSSGHPNFSETTTKNDDDMNVATPAEAFRVLFDDAILDKIIIHTNEEIERVMSLLLSKDHLCQSIHKKIDKEELCAYLGLCFYSAYFRENELCVKDMWDDLFGRGIYRATLSEKRFEFLNRALRFDDKNTRSERRATDKLAPIREIWDIFIQNCTNNFQPASNCTIDEQHKPEIIMSYNCYKGATDTFGEKSHHLSTARRTPRWTLRFFYNMLDQSAVNARVLYNMNADNPRLSRKKFLKKLAFGLVEPHLRRRLGIATIRASIKKIIRKLLEIDEPVPTVVRVIKENTRAKCHLCESNAVGRTRMKCPNCLRRMCDDHRAAICVECSAEN